MKNFKLQTLAVFVVLALGLSSCYTSSYYMKHAKIDVSKIPADFNPKKHILLVAEIVRRTNANKQFVSATKKLDEAFRENYPYRYEIVSIDDIENRKGKYADTSVYKYAVTYHLTYSRYETTSSVTTFSSTQHITSGQTTVFIDFSFYDRSKKYEYPVTGNKSTRIDYLVMGLTATVEKAQGGKKS